MLDTNPKGKEFIEAELAKIFGQKDSAFSAIAEMDPDIGSAFVALAKGSDSRKALAPKDRSLISLCLSASVTSLQEKHTRMHMAEALRRGATKEEICEVLELTSVLGIHGFIPGTRILVERHGGIEGLRKALSPEQLKAAEEAKAAFLAARGYMGDVWEANCLLAPEFVKAYAVYSGVPWKTTALSGKMKEFIYVAIDLSPTHMELGGAAYHMNAALDKYGATLDEIMEVLEVIGLMGFQTHLLAMPILKEELAKLR